MDQATQDKIWFQTKTKERITQSILKYYRNQDKETGEITAIIKSIEEEKLERSESINMLASILLGRFQKENPLKDEGGDNPWWSASAYGAVLADWEKISAYFLDMYIFL